MAEVKQRIEIIADRRMPEARLFTLAARAALSPTKTETKEKDRPIIHGQVSVSDIRQYGAILKQNGETNEESEEKISRGVQEKIKKERKIKARLIWKFIFEKEVNIEKISLETVLLRIEGWLGKKDQEDEDNIGLPLVLKTSIARGSPEVWLLLMWLAKRSLEEPYDDKILGLEMRTRVLGLATALHWFGNDKGRAVQKIAAKLHGKPVEPTQFEGILAEAYEVESRNGIGLYPPLSPADLDKMIVVPECANAFKDWKWYGQIRDENSRRMKWPFLQRIKNEREILLYAQRQYIKSRFSGYDPARSDMWEQHNRPWDFDHILAKAKIDYVQEVPNKEALKEWIHSVANLRACPMEENRSDQQDNPTEKLDSNKLAESFISQEEVERFDLGAKNISEPEKALAFVGAAKSRLIGIYKEWYNILEIGVLTKDEATPEIVAE